MHTVYSLLIAIMILITTINVLCYLDYQVRVHTYNDKWACCPELANCVKHPYKHLYALSIV